MAQFVIARLVITFFLYLACYPADVASQKGHGMPFCSMDAVLACASHFQSAVGWTADVVRVRADQHRILCRALGDAESCIGNLTRSCRLQRVLVGLLPAYRLVCKPPDGTDPGYNEHFRCFDGIPDLNCLGMYPQVLPMAAPHIVRRVNSIVPLVFSQSNDSQIYMSVCRHLLSSRDIFCSDFLLRLGCGISAARWQTNFMKTLFQLTSQSPREITFRNANGADSTIDLTNCSRLGDERIVKACQLSNNCTAVLNTFAMNVRFGVFTFSDNDLKTFCRLSPEEMQTCVSELIPRCSILDTLIYNGSLKVHEKICFTSNKAEYLAHRKCLSEVVIRPGFYSILNCTDELTDAYKYVGRTKLRNDSAETALCNAGAYYLDCLQTSLSGLCGVETAAWQRKMTRFMLAEAFQLTFCTFVFGHDDIEDRAVAGNSQSLKFSWLAAAAAAAIWSRYAKHVI